MRPIRLALAAVSRFACWNDSGPHRIMKYSSAVARLGPLIVGFVVVITGCRIEKVRTTDTASASNEPGPGLLSCGISPESRISEDGIGVLRIGASLDAVRASCTVVSERAGANDAPLLANVDLGRDTAAVEFIMGALRRITLHHQAYRTADSLGVGTHVGQLLNIRNSTGITDRGKLYAVTPTYCGLRFMLVDPAPAAPSVQSGRAALRRLSGETRTRELEIVGCQPRR